MTNSISEVVSNDVIFVIGSNTTENHPIIGTYIKRAVKAGAKLIVADPRRIELSEFSDVYLQIKPGTNVALINGMMHHIYMKHLHDEAFIKASTEGFAEVISIMEVFSVADAAKICEVDESLIRKAAEIYAAGPKSAIYYAMGITQHSTGTDHVKAVANLAMMCGYVGKFATGVNPLRGQNNVQGACDMGGLPNVYPGYQKAVDDSARLKFESAWGVSLSSKLGLTIPKMMAAASNDSLKMLYVMGENPMVSDPDLNHIEEALENLEFLVVQDIFLNETALKADVVLPAACFAEKEGTFTNTERRIQRIHQAVTAPGEALEDWVIFDRLMHLMGYENHFTSPSEIMNEIASLTPQYAGISYDRLKESSLQWPCTSYDHPGTQYLHKDLFAKGIGTFHAVEHIGPKESPDEEYPYILTTGRILYHYHTRTMTGKSDGINETVGSAYMEISSEVAKKLGVVDQEIVCVSSRRGSIELRAIISEKVTANVVFIPFHFAEAAANRLTHNTLDKITDIPEYKVCAVKVEKL